MADDMHYLLWDINTYVCNGNLSDEEKMKLSTLCQNIKDAMKENLNIE